MEIYKRLHVFKYISINIKAWCTEEFRENGSAETPQCLSLLRGGA